MALTQVFIAAIEGAVSTGFLSTGSGKLLKQLCRFLQAQVRRAKTAVLMRSAEESWVRDFSRMLSDPSLLAAPTR